jgi:YVTN family beta-propeller protein
MGFHASGLMMYVPNADDDTLSVMYAATDAVITTVPVGDFPIVVIMDPRDDTTAYVANTDDATISIVDLPTNTITGSIPVDPSPFAIVVHPRERTLYANSFDAGTVTVIDLETKSVVDTIAIGSGPIDLVLSPVAPCPADVDGSGAVGFPDLLTVLSAWGPCP